MRVYVDWPWSDDVVYYGAPVRVYVHTRRWSYMVGARGQRWDPRFGWTDEMRVVVRWPTETCRYDLDDQTHCPLEKDHAGRHWNWRKQWLQTERYS